MYLLTVLAIAKKISMQNKRLYTHIKNNTGLTNLRLSMPNKLIEEHLLMQSEFDRSNSQYYAYEKLFYKIHVTTLSNKVPFRGILRLMQIK